MQILGSKIPRNTQSNSKICYHWCSVPGNASLMRCGIYFPCPFHLIISQLIILRFFWKIQVPDYIIFCIYNNNNKWVYLYTAQWNLQADNKRFGTTYYRPVPVEYYLKSAVNCWGYALYAFHIGRHGDCTSKSTTCTVSGSELENIE